MRGNLIKRARERESFYRARAERHSVPHLCLWRDGGRAEGRRECPRSDLALGPRQYAAAERAARLAWERRQHHVRLSQAQGIPWAPTRALLRSESDPAAPWNLPGLRTWGDRLNRQRERELLRDARARVHHGLTWGQVRALMGAAERLPHHKRHPLPFHDEWRHAPIVVRYLPLGADMRRLPARLHRLPAAQPYPPRVRLLVFG